MFRYFFASISLLIFFAKPLTPTSYTEFYNQFVEENANRAPEDSQIGDSFPPTPPTPPSQAIAPAPKKGFFPVVISNGSTQSNNQVYMIVLNNGLTQVLYLRGKFPGEMAISAVTGNTYSPDFSYPLSDLPTSTTGSDDFLMYVPNEMKSGRIYFSIGNPLYLLNNTTSVTAPQSFSFHDPNFNVLYDFAELTITKITPPTPASDIKYQPFLDTTQVDNWSLPIMLGLYSLNLDNPTVKTPYQPAGAPATNFAGFSGNRDTLINTIVTGLTSPAWDQLALPFHTDPYSPGVPTTYLRILAPKTGTTQTLPQPEGDYTIPQFPLNYLTTPTDFLTLLYNFYPGVPSLYIKADGGSNQIYQGVASGDTFTFTSTSNSNHKLTLSKSAITVSQMYGGVLPFVNMGAPAGDIPIIQKLFGSAFTVGLLGVPSLFDSAGAPLDDNNLMDHLPRVGGPITAPAYYNTPAIFPSASYDLYAELLHSVAILPTSPPYPSSPGLPTVGLCYAYDYDDALGMSSTVAPPATTKNSENIYAILTLGTIPTIPTGVYDDGTTYNLTFTFPPSVTFKYRQGTSGPFTTATSPAVIPAVTSTSDNPFQISHNGKIFNVFPKYQFFQPIDKFTTPYDAVIQGTTFTPDVPAAPTGFTIALPG
jgi:hypothetical protein